MRAALCGHKDTLRMLLDAGADTSPASKVSSSVCVWGGGGGVRL
jgi:hypothetical protein